MSQSMRIKLILTLLGVGLIIGLWKEERYEIVASNLGEPWEMIILPENQILITQRTGEVLLIDRESGDKIILLDLTKKIKKQGEGGLLGMALHPNFVTNNYVYLFYTYSDEDNQLRNRVSRFTKSEDKINNEE